MVLHFTWPFLKKIEEGVVFITQCSPCNTTGVVYCLSRRMKEMQSLYIEEPKKKDWLIIFQAALYYQNEGFLFPMKTHFNSDGHNINHISVCVIICCYGCISEET